MERSIKRPAMSLMWKVYRIKKEKKKRLMPVKRGYHSVAEAAQIPIATS
jgi:hypothetical protein